MKNKILLWITPKWPLPAHDGARIATVNLVRSLTQLGYQIILLTLASNDEPVNTSEAKRFLSVKDIFNIYRSPNPQFTLYNYLGIIKSILFNPTIPVTMRNYSSKHLRFEITKIINNIQPDIIVYDGLHPAIHSIKNGKFTRNNTTTKLIYRAHNHESSLWIRKSQQTNNPLIRLFLNWQAGIVQTFETSLLEHSDAVATVSQDDLVLFQKNTNNIRGFVVPIGYDFNLEIARPKQTNNQIMFLGRLDWHPNKDGLIWFLTEVWPHIFKKYKLTIAGSGNAEWLKSFLNQPNIIFLGRVEEVSKLYEKSMLSIVPLFYGSGTRVKVIEASRYGCPCLSTALGVEGLGLIPNFSFFHAETAAEWIDCLNSFDFPASTQIGINAHNAMKDVFESLNTAKKFADIIESF